MILDFIENFSQNLSIPNDDFMKNPIARDDFMRKKIHFFAFLLLKKIIYFQLYLIILFQEKS